MIDRFGQLVLAAPRATVVPLLVIGVALAVLAMLAPALFLRRREPFDRLMEFLELVLGRGGGGARSQTDAGEWGRRRLPDRRFPNVTGGYAAGPRPRPPGRRRAGRIAVAAVSGPRRRRWATRGAE